MEISAIIYTSETGHTRQYAEMLGRKLEIPVYELDNCQNVKPGSDILYMGWLFASKVKGYAKAKKKFNIRAVCGVGMSKYGSLVGNMLRMNKIGEDVLAFCIPGGYEPEKLRGMNKLLMKFMVKFLGKKIEKKAERTDDDTEMLRILYDGGVLVDSAYIEPVFEALK